MNEKRENQRLKEKVDWKLMCNPFGELIRLVNRQKNRVVSERDSTVSERER